MDGLERREFWFADIEWDEPKRQKTRLGRGLDFLDLLPFCTKGGVGYVRVDNRFDYGEVRFVTISAAIPNIGVVTFVATERLSQVLRIISLRRATENEKQAYHEAEKHR